MDKFKKAIEQLNKPIEQATAEEAAIEASVEIAEETPKTEQQTIRDEAVSQSELEAELEKEFLAEHPESPVVSKKRKKQEREALKKQAKADRIEQKKQAKLDKITNKENRKEYKRAKKENKKLAKTAKKEGNTAELAVEETPKSEKSSLRARITPIVVIAAIILVVAGGFANYKMNNQLKPTFYQVQSSKVVDNVRIVAISDMHLKEFGENNTRLVDKIASYHPDIIAIVGDMNIDDNPDYSEVINVCARLNNVSKLYYCLGNHEFEAMLFEDSQIYYDLEAAGINVLNNETETVEIGLSTIDVIGLTQGPKRFRTDAEKFFEEAMSATDNFKLVLTHYPENFQGVIEEYPIDLAICGHAHGGQVRLPYIGGLYSSDQGLFPKLCDGYHEIENSKVVISRGLGRSGLMPRINNPPEITIIDVNWY